MLRLSRLASLAIGDRSVKPRLLPLELGIGRHRGDRRVDLDPRALDRCARLLVPVEL